MGVLGQRCNPVYAWLNQSHAQTDQIPVDTDVLTTRANRNCGLAMTFDPAGTPINLKMTTDVTPDYDNDGAAKVTCRRYHALLDDLNGSFSCTICGCADLKYHRIWCDD